jgi:hypothetical protein
MVIVEFTANGKIKLEIEKIKTAQVVGRILQDAGLKFTASELSFTPIELFKDSEQKESPEIKTE